MQSLYYRKNTEDFYNKYTECKICNSKRSLKSYYENKDKISNQKKLYCEKDREKLIPKQNDRYINYSELLRSSAELVSELKIMEENFKTNESDKH